MKAKEFETKPRNFVAKNAKMGGAGQHKDKKKAEKQGDVKHKQKLVPMETIEQKLARKIQENLEQGVAEGSEQQFMIYFVVPEHDDYPDRREPTERTIVVANSPGEAARLFKAETPEAYIKDVVAMKQGVAEGLRDPQDNPCWKGYYPVGTKKKNGRTVPNCVPRK